MHKALGRGLEALIPAPSYVNKESDSIVKVPIDKIYRNNRQPRSHFEHEAMKELADSVREKGIIQPIVVMPYQNGYQIIIGERRWRAAQMAGLSEVPAVIKQFPPQEIFEVSLIENIWFTRIVSEELSAAEFSANLLP